ncbi:MAG: InlB B-repeat-containing protein [Lachnospiraceae bacterium]|nr:InlB B-repeat-containing protein [Lachnospiraceae bacterium]
MKNVKKHVALLVLVLVGIIMFDNKDVYAATKYTVTYNPGQGTGKNISMKGNKGETMVAPGQPGSYKYGDYRFLGWSLNKNATEASITQGSKFTLNRNMTLYAVWSDTTYIVYERNGGQTGPKGVVPVKIGNAYVSKTAPTKSGYVFAGWILDTDKSKIYNPGDKINCKTTTGLTAKWKCRVKYIDSLDTNKTVSYDTTIGNVEVAAGQPGKFGKTGYKFLGWAYDKNATKPSITTGTKFTVNKNVTLYAVWDNKVSLTYNSNGGSNGPTGVTNSVYGKAIQIKTKVPTRTGYDFVGWVLAGDESKVYKPGGTITLYKNGTLKAKWELKQYNVNYRPNGGEGNIVTRNYKHGKEITIIRKPSAIIRTGYTFKGWATSSNGNVKYNPGDKITISNNMDLYAVWELNKYEIKMNPNGGDLNGINATRTKYYGKDITISKKTPVREGYVFIGYATEKNSKIVAYKKGETLSVNKDLTLYAVWEKQYIELDTNGSGQKVQYYEVNNDGYAYELPKLTRTGYNFKGWSENKNATEGYFYVTYKASDYFAAATSSGFEYKMNIGTSKHGKLYAVWEEDIYTVEYDLNGGTGGFEKVKVDLNNYKVPLEKPTKAGYIFLGWSQDKNATVPSILPGDKINEHRNITLYAIWSNGIGGTVYYKWDDNKEIYEDVHYNYAGVVWKEVYLTTEETSALLIELNNDIYQCELILNQEPSKLDIFCDITTVASDIFGLDTLGDVASIAELINLTSDGVVTEEELIKYNVELLVGKIPFTSTISVAAKHLFIPVNKGLTALELNNLKSQRDICKEAISNKQGLRLQFLYEIHTQETIINYSVWDKKTYRMDITMTPPDFESKQLKGVYYYGKDLNTIPDWLR